MYELEKNLEEVRNDCRILSEEREEILKKIGGPTKKKWNLGSIFKRKKRNSDIN